jgi:DNA-binding MarR family transcriptional regulator
MKPNEEGAPDEEGEVKLGKVLDFLRLLWTVNHRLESTSKRMVGSLGVTGPQRLVVRIVGRYPGISAGRLAAILQIHPSTLTGILRRLEERGALQRKPDEGDARRALFSLTAKGRTLDQQRNGTAEAAVQRALAHVNAKQMVDVERVLSALAEELAKE